MKCRRCNKQAIRKRTLCATCESRNETYRAACYATALAQGYCTVRGCKAARAPDRKRCAYHVLMQREASRRRNAKDRKPKRAGKPKPAKSIVTALDDYDSVL